MKEKQFHRCNPHLPVKNVQETLDYYRDVLGFCDEWVWKDDQGRITDGGIRRDNMRLLFADDPGFIATINSYTKSRFPLMWFVDNIEAIYAEFQNRKIVIEDPLQDQPYGVKEFSFIDINGYYIRITEGI